MIGKFAAWLLIAAGVFNIVIWPRFFKAIVDDAMPGKHVDVDDNLFDVGASSLTLIQIHEKIDEAYPGMVDLTELFDFPTISMLAKRLESKIGS